VNRLSEFIGPMPKASSFASPGGDAKLAEYGKRSAHALKSLGFNMNFAPVVDLSAPGAASGIGDRAFGTDPKGVTRLAGIYLDALQAEGVAGCLKHFPGLGPTDADTHLSMPTTKKSPDALWAEDMVPFRELAPRAGAIMIGHAHYAAIDDDRSVAATLSTHVVKEQLREKMGYDGLAITDDMEMGAVAQEMTPDELALFAFLMGSDMVMFAGNKTRILNARRGIVRAIHAARLFKDRIDQSIGRILAVKERFGVESFPADFAEADYASAKTALQGLAKELGAA
jgi:beta-N-acetylhexosaminidase